MPNIDSKKILEDVRENHARLKNCPGPHDFVKTNPESYFSKYRCTLCGGEIDGVKLHWYREGLKHGAHCAP